MYESFFALESRPFELTPDPRFLFETPQHSEALSCLRYGLRERKGLIVLTGEAGTGKTTVVRAAVAEHEQHGGRLLYLANPTLSVHDFHETLARGFGLGDEALRSKAALLRELTTVLFEDHARERLAALVVDEAQSLPSELLEEIRLLANVETPNAKLLQLVLAGQPEFAARLNEPGLRQLKQRIALRSSLLPLTPNHTSAYISGRIRIAGGEPTAVFTGAAVELIHMYAGGIPRWINVLGDNALLTAFAENVKPVTGRVVLEVARDLDLELSALPVQCPAPEPHAERLAATACLVPPSSRRRAYGAVKRVFADLSAEVRHSVLR